LYNVQHAAILFHPPHCSLMRMYAVLPSLLNPLCSHVFSTGLLLLFLVHSSAIHIAKESITKGAPEKQILSNVLVTHSSGC